MQCNGGPGRRHVLAVVAGMEQHMPAVGVLFGMAVGIVHGMTVQRRFDHMSGIVQLAGDRHDALQQQCDTASRAGSRDVGRRNRDMSAA